MHSAFNKNVQLNINFLILLKANVLLL